MMIDVISTEGSRSAGQPPVRNAVCLCTDRNMLIPALFVARAVQTTARSGVPFDVVIVAETAEVSDVHRAWMAEHGILLHEVDLSHLHGVAQIQERLSVAVLSKLLLAEMFAGRYDHIVYLDADLTIHGDVTALFDLDIGAFPLAAVPSGLPWAFHDEGERRKAAEHFAALGMTKPYRYFNSGVLLIDTARWNDTGLAARTLDFISHHADICLLPDEDGLNAILDGAFARLSPIWNARPPRKSIATASIAQPVIVHYMGADKPWRRFGYHKRLFPDRTAYRMYEAFLADTPWPHWLRDQWTVRDLRANIAWEMRRLTRRLRGRPDPEPSRQQRKEYLAALAEFCATESFVDVEQGVAVRQGGVLRLRPRVLA